MRTFTPAPHSAPLTLTRRELIKAGGALMTISAMGCFSSTQAPATLLKIDAPTSARLGNMRIHAIQTGWVQVKAPHRELSGPQFARLATIMASRTWTEWMPILCWAIEHPEGLIIVDAGETAQTKDATYFECDKNNGFFYTRNLRFDVTPEQEIGPQLRAIGLDPDKARVVVNTHVHSDHMGGLGHFKRSQFLSSEDVNTARGVLSCRFPSSYKPQHVKFDAAHAVPGFGGAYSLTSTHDVLVIPTPGHTKHHQSVLVRTPEVSVLLAGDTSFDELQLREGTLAGIREAPDEAAQTLKRLRHLAKKTPLVYLPSHDPESMTRLEALQAVWLDVSGGAHR